MSFQILHQSLFKAAQYVTGSDERDLVFGGYPNTYATYDDFLVQLETAAAIQPSFILISGADLLFYNGDSDITVSVRAATDDTFASTVDFSDTFDPDDFLPVGQLYIPLTTLPSRSFFEIELTNGTGQIQLRKIYFGRPFSFDRNPTVTSEWSYSPRLRERRTPLTARLIFRGVSKAKIQEFELTIGQWFKRDAVVLRDSTCRTLQGRSLVPVRITELSDRLTGVGSYEVSMSVQEVV
jgi:hypothetical protein